MYKLSPLSRSVFAGSSMLKYQLPGESNVDISIYDISGRMVNNIVSGVKKAGVYKININASDYSSGTYFIRMKADEYEHAERMTIVR
ncbi:MAG: T9SS type A sorting domain-containing protein [bacterium]